MFTLGCATRRKMSFGGGKFNYVYMLWNILPSGISFIFLLQSNLGRSSLEESDIVCI